MQIQHLSYRIRGFYRVAKLGHRCSMKTSKEASRRLEILGFYQRHGLAAACEAFQVSSRTLYRWRRALRQADNNPAALTRRSCAPRRPRRARWATALVSEIRRLRRVYPNLGKDKLHVLLRPWCAQQRLPLPSASTIGRIVARDPRKMRHTPRRLDSRGRPKPLARKRKPRKPKVPQTRPLEMFASDTVVRMRDGLRRYLFTFIDPRSRFAVAFISLCQLLPQPPRFVLSDNASEFLGHFQRHLEQQHITHWWTYPRCPRMNAHVERFNRTLQEEFVEYHEALLFEDIAAFNRNLGDYLVHYNTQRPHLALALNSPVQYLLNHHHVCQRWWTYTVS